MAPPRIWRGIRMRDTAAGADPDAEPRPLTLPAAWDDRAAAGLAALAPGTGQADLARAAEAWIRPVATRARQAGDDALAERLHRLLLNRQAAPTAPVWGAADGMPGFVLNLPAFADGARGLDCAAFAEAVSTAATALRLGDPLARCFAISITDLDGLLATMGLDYGSPAAQEVAACIAALLRATADLAFAGEQPDLLSRLPSWPLPPASCAAPGLAAAAYDARMAALRGAGSLPCTAIVPPGPADALLGAETGGIAPAFSRNSVSTRIASFAPTPGARVTLARSPAAMAPTSSLGERVERMASATLAPTP